LFLAVTAHRFGCRPSELVRLRDPVLALDFDLAAAARLLNVERAAAEGLAQRTDDAPLASGPSEVRW
jgi:hypothetical protein